MLEALGGVGDRLKDAGHNVQLLALPEEVSKAYENHMRLIASEVARVHRDLFTEYGQAYPPKLRDLILLGNKVSNERLQDIYSHRGQTMSVFDKLFETYDLLLAPAAPGPAPKGIQTTGDHRMNLLTTYTGQPALTLPCALSSDGLPLGVQLVGRKNNDQFVLAVGSLIEDILSFSEHPQLPSDI